MSANDGKIFIFRNTHETLTAEKILLRAGFRPQVIPVPKEISSDCGVALLVDKEDFLDASMALEKGKLAFSKSLDAQEIESK